MITGKISSKNVSRVASMRQALRQLKTNWYSYPHISILIQVRHSIDFIIIGNIVYLGKLIEFSKQYKPKLLHLSFDTKFIQILHSS